MAHSIDLGRVVKFILPNRKGDLLVRAGVIFIGASLIGGYKELFSIVPAMQYVGVVVGVILILIGVWISNERSKRKSSRDRKLA